MTGWAEALERHVWTDDQEREEVWQLSRTGVELLAETKADPESPLSSLAKTLPADLTLAARSSTPTGRRAEAATAAEATSRQARLTG